VWFGIENKPGLEEKLARVHIPVVLTPIVEPREMTCLAFPEEDRTRVLALADLQNELMEDVSTNNREVRLLQKPERVVFTHTFEYEAQLKDVFTAYANRKNIRIKIFSGNNRNTSGWTEPTRNEIHIRSLSSPKETSVGETRNVMFGVNLGYSAKILKPSGLGLQIIDYELGITLAEFFENSLFLLFNIDIQRGPIVINKILEQLDEIEKQTPEERENMQEKIKERVLLRDRTEYVMACKKRIQNETNTARSKLEEARKSIDEAQRTIAIAVRNELELSKRLSGLEIFGSELQQRFEREFDQLTKVPGVTKVSVDKDNINVFTETIFITFENVEYEIGKFRIQISTSESHPAVNCFNLDRRIRKHHHPHVHNDEGRVCFGNISASIAKLLGAYEYAVLAQVIIRFLHTFNPEYIDQPDLRVDNWPEAKKGGKS